MYGAHFFKLGAAGIEALLALLALAPLAALRGGGLGRCGFVAAAGVVVTGSVELASGWGWSASGAGGVVSLMAKCDRCGVVRESAIAGTPAVDPRANDPRANGSRAQRSGTAIIAAASES
jgi:hypothetical protein